MGHAFRFYSAWYGAFGFCIFGGDFLHLLRVLLFFLRFMKLHQLGEHYGDFCVGFHSFYLGNRTGNLFIDMGAHPT